MMVDGELLVLLIIMSLLEQLFVNSCRNQGATLSLSSSPVAMQEPLKSIIQRFSPQKIKTSVTSSAQKGSPIKRQSRVIYLIQTLEMLTADRQRELKYSAITTLKRNHRSRAMLERKKQRIIVIPPLKAVKTTPRQQQPMHGPCFAKEQSRSKIGITVLQRVQVQNCDYSYNAGIFLIDLQQREQLFRSYEMSCTGSEMSFSKDKFGTTKNSTFNQQQAIMTPLYRPSKRVSTDTVFSDVVSYEQNHLEGGREQSNVHNFAKGKEVCVVERIEGCLFGNPATHAFLEQSRDECLFEREEELAVIESEGQVTNSWSSFRDMHNFKDCFYDRAIDQQIELTKRQLDALITCRKEKEERRYSTLQEIVKSKEIIQQLVADLNQVRQPREKMAYRHIVRTGEKESHSANRDRQPRTAMKRFTSSLADIQSPHLYNSLRKVNSKVSISKWFKGRRQKTHQSEIIKEMTQEQDAVSHTQRRIDVYSQYVKGKKTMDLCSTSKGKPSCYKGSNGKLSEREEGSGKKGKIQNILLSLSKFPPCTERRIDLKIDLVKQNRSNNHLLTDRAKRGTGQGVLGKIKLGRK